mmetsp:Transcript_16894/g.55276  ORF Transcript_16894/g.55276 Transcript_16894/m.55276 type:complete len:201 (+) Transcript_16894:745-1347(+)
MGAPPLLAQAARAVGRARALAQHVRPAGAAWRRGRRRPAPPRRGRGLRCSARLPPRRARRGAGGARHSLPRRRLVRQPRRRRPSPDEGFVLRPHERGGSPHRAPRRFSARGRPPRRHAPHLHLRPRRATRRSPPDRQARLLRRELPRAVHYPRPALAGERSRAARASLQRKRRPHANRARVARRKGARPVRRAVALALPA